MRETKKKLCKQCGKLCKRAGVKFCSTKCYTDSRRGVSNSNKGRKQSKETIDKRIANTDQSKKEEQRKQTMLGKYGVDNPSLLEGASEKISAAHKGKKKPRVEGQQDAIIETKRRNGKLNHTEETKEKISKALKAVFSNPDFDRSVFVNESSNGKNSKTGYYNGIYYRSSYEEMFLKFCENYNILIESAANKEHVIKYESLDGSIRSYYPDFYLPESGTIVEIKPISLYDIGENPGKFHAACQSVCNYVVLTELDGFLYEDEWQDFYECDVKYWSKVL